MNAVLAILLNHRGLAGILLAGLIAAGWLHYRGLVNNLEAARQDLASARANLEAALAVAEQNAEAALQADEDRRRVVAELEAAHEQLAAAAAANREAEAGVLAAPDDHDGPVAPLLDDLRVKRFGGSR